MHEMGGFFQFSVMWHESFYKRTRRHSHLGGVSPDQFEVIVKQRRKGLY